MKYTATIAIMDGVPDAAGDILRGNVSIPKRRVIVSNEFTAPVIGLATVTQNGDRLEAEIEIDEKLLHPDVAEQLHGVIGGMITSRNGASIEAWTLREVAITDAPCDKRLPKLKRKV